MIRQYLSLVFTLLFVVSGYSQNLSCAKEIKLAITPDNKINLTNSDGAYFSLVDRSEGDINRWETIYSGASISSYTDESVVSGKTYMYRLLRSSVIS